MYEWTSSLPQHEKNALLLKRCKRHNKKNSITRDKEPMAKFEAIHWCSWYCNILNNYWYS